MIERSVNSIRLDDLSSLYIAGPVSYGESCNSELFQAVVRLVTDLQDCGGADSKSVVEFIGRDRPDLLAQSSRGEIQSLADLVLNSEIPSLSASFQESFDAFNARYFGGRLTRYRVRVVFDLHRCADEPVYDHHVSSGLVRFEEKCIYIRYTSGDRGS
jgi:hypothetical protein